MMPRTLFLAMVSLACLSALQSGSGMVAGQANALIGEPSGHIEGRVEVRLDNGRHRRPSIQSLGAKAPPRAPDRKRTIVYLERAPRGAFESAENRTAVLDQVEETFVPYVLPVQVGTLVRFPNNDSVFHNVFSLSKVKKFDLGRYPKGESKTVRFSEPGVVRLFCDIHSHMSAFIVVFSHRYFAVTDDGGNYRIPDVPIGRYTLVAWTDGETRASATVNVGAGESTRADFVVQ